MIQINIAGDLIVCNGVKNCNGLQGAITHVIRNKNVTEATYKLQFNIVMVQTAFHLI